MNIRSKVKSRNRSKSKAFNTEDTECTEDWKLYLVNHALAQISKNQFKSKSRSKSKAFNTENTE